MLQEIESSLPKGAMSNYVPEKSLADFIRELSWSFSRKYAPPTLKEYEAAFARLRDFLEAPPRNIKSLSGINPNIMESYRRELEASVDPDEIDFQFFLLKSAFDFAIAKSYMSHNPLIYLKRAEYDEGILTKGLDLAEKTKRAGSAEELVIQYLRDEPRANERLKLLKWNMLRDDQLKAALVAKLMKAQVPLERLVEIFAIENIRELKPFAGWSRTEH